MGPASSGISAATWPNLYSRAASLRYQRRAALEAYQASLADYQQVVITAFQQVADTLRAVENDARTLKAQSEALGAATQALQLMKANHQAGLVNYLQILNADNQYQQAKLGLIQAHALRLQDTTALFVALGGGWWHPDTKIIGDQVPGSRVNDQIEVKRERKRLVGWWNWLFRLCPKTCFSQSVGRECSTPAFFA